MSMFLSFVRLTECRLSNFDWETKSEDEEHDEVRKAMAWVQRDSRIVNHEDMAPQIWSPPFNKPLPPTDVINLFTESLAPVAREHFQDEIALRYPDEAKGVPNASNSDD